MDSNNISNLDKFSWTTIQNGRVAKELDYSCFKYAGSGIPQEYYSFFRVNSENKSNEITIIYEDLSYNCKLKWARPKSPILRIFWDDNFTALLKSKFPHWEEIVPHQKLTNMKLIFSRTEESNVFLVDFDEVEKFVGWSEEELSSVLDAYLQMLNIDASGKKVQKQKIYKDLSTRFGRAEKSFEYAMQNFSYVFDQLGRNWLTGITPRKNVGSREIEIIDRLLQAKENSKEFFRATFETKVDELITRKFLEKPSGKKSPTKSVSVTSSYSRDENIVAWVLRESKGVCELCREKAPFEKPNGRFYLEVHHLKRLADGGSDTPENAIAICPNCHKELHFGQHRSMLLEKVYVNVKRLERE